MGELIAQPVISVIIPVYKVEEYLRQCVDSVIAQTYANLEIILVDDGSPDNCPQICDEYAQRDSRIKVIHQKNAGVCAAREAGVQAATGAYISFVDSDDYISSEYYASLLALMGEDDFIISGVSLMDENGNECSKNIPQSNEICALVSSSLFGYACNKLYTAKVVKNHSYLQYANLLREDLLYNLSLLNRKEKCTFCTAPNVGYYYRQWGESVLHVTTQFPKETVIATLQTANQAVSNIRFLSEDERSDIFDMIAFVLISDALSRVDYNSQSVGMISSYVKELLHAVPQNALRYIHASNNLWKIIWLSKRLSCNRILAIVLKYFIYRSKK